MSAGEDAQATQRDDTPPSEEATGAAPSQLGRYPVMGMLGAGGMGEVLEVKDSQLGRVVAAKVIRGATDPRRLQQFVQEAQVTGQLEHPNIVPVHELGTDPEGRVYFTMKRVEGEDLASILAREQDAGGWDLAPYLQVFLKVCDAIAFAHSRGVVHGDLKPSNIMVGRFGEVLVCDWGLAKLRGASDRGPGVAPPDAGCGQVGAGTGGSTALLWRTREGELLGTPAYMSPEQARSMSGRTSGPSAPSSTSCSPAVPRTLERTPAR